MAKEVVDTLKPALVHEGRPLLRKLRSQPTNMGAISQAVGQDPCFSMTEGLTGNVHHRQDEDGHRHMGMFEKE